MIELFGDMFNEMDGASLVDLTEEQQTMLIEALDLRNQMMGHAIKMNALRIKLMQEPSPEGEQVLNDYADIYVAPLRDKIAESTAKILDEAIDVEELMKILPAALSALSRSVNFPLLLTAAGFDPDTTRRIIKSMTDYFRSGME